MSASIPPPPPPPPPARPAGPPPPSRNAVDRLAPPIPAPVPLSPPPVVPASTSVPGPGPGAYRPVLDLARWTVRLLAGVAVVAAIGSILEILQLGLLGRVLMAAPDEISGNDARMAVYGWTELVLAAAASTAFVFWFRRVASNLRALGHGSPVVHRPVDVLARTWGTGDVDRETPWWLRPWAWSVVVATGLITLGRAISLAAGAVIQLQLASTLFLLGDLSLVVAALGAIAVVRSASGSQEAAMLSARSPDAVPAFVN